VTSSGKIFMGEKEIGTFEVYPWPWDAIEAKFQRGLKVQKALEHARDKGLVVQLKLDEDEPS
jgi:hypothetical protein